MGFAEPNPSYALRAFAAVKEPGPRRSLLALVETMADACARGARAKRAWAAG
jgi:HEAT repeat protein